MFKKAHGLGIKLKKWTLVNPDKMLLAGCILVVPGIIMSSFNISWANLVILAGTFCFGLGFYLKGKNNSSEKLSHYGHFMLGLGTLIALPQAPEMLKHILRIEQGVEELTYIRQLDDGKAIIQSLVPLREARSQEDMEKSIKGLIRSQEAKSAEYPRIGVDSSIPAFERPPTPGTAYLSKEKGDKIIKSLTNKPFDKYEIEALVQENLEVWHPKANSLKHSELKIK